MDEPVQGDQPQGGEATETPLESFLSTVPEAQREYVEPYLKEAEKNVNGRLQEAAEFQKTWEPYKEAFDPQTYSPEVLKELTGWHQEITSSDDAWSAWLSKQAEEAGFTRAEAEALDEAEEQGELTREEVQKLVAEAAAQQTAPIQEQFEALQREKGIDQEDAAIKTELGRLEGEHSMKLTKEQQIVVLDLGMPFALDDQGNELPPGDASWVAKGIDRFREIYAEGQKAFVTEKTGAPAPNVTGGGREQFKPSNDWKTVESQARERLRQAQS